MYYMANMTPTQLAKAKIMLSHDALKQVCHKGLEFNGVYDKQCCELAQFESLSSAMRTEILRDALFTGGQARQEVYQYLYENQSLMGSK